jgi:hypothetical protein
VGSLSGTIPHMENFWGLWFWIYVTRFGSWRRRPMLQQMKNICRRRKRLCHRLKKWPGLQRRWWKISYIWERNVLPILISPILYLPYFLVGSLTSCLIYCSRFKHQFMYRTKICHFCTTIVELNARWLTRCLIYWTVNDSRSKYQLMCWRHPTSMDTGL